MLQLLTYSPVILICAVMSGFVSLMYVNRNMILNYVKKYLFKKKKGTHYRKLGTCRGLKLDSDPLSYFQRIFLYSDIFVLGIFAHIREALRFCGIEKRGLFEKNREGYVSLYNTYTRFYINNILKRGILLLNHTICGVPGATVDVLERMSPDYGWTIKFTGKVIRQVNLASYNYLGFAQNNGSCTVKAASAVERYGLSSSSSRCELGTSEIINELEALTSRFLGVEASMVFAMGFATNTMNIPALVDKKCLVLSDELNHASIIHGCCLSGAVCEKFRHADMDDLEEKLVYYILRGQPTYAPWKKILIVVEGIYSMEGTIVNLPRLIGLKKKYKAYLYLDEAHSIGAVGKRGRGVVDFYGCNPKDIDILMGTFTKSFGSVGGYIAGSKKLISHLKRCSHNYVYGSPMAPPAAAQIISAMKIIMGEDGTNDGILRIKQLSDNTAYFRTKLMEMGFSLIGSQHSPVVVIMLYQGIKVFIQAAFQKKGVALVGVGFPVVPLGKTRLRVCISAGHTKEMLDKALQAFDKLGDWMSIKYMKGKKSRSVTQ